MAEFKKNSVAMRVSLEQLTMFASGDWRRKVDYTEEIPVPEQEWDEYHEAVALLERLREFDNFNEGCSCEHAYIDEPRPRTIFHYAETEEEWEARVRAKLDAGEGIQTHSSFFPNPAILARDYRVLERAKPRRPEWEAVVASFDGDREHRRELFVRGMGGEWVSKSWFAAADELVDPAPLVEMPSREALRGKFHTIWGHHGGEWPGSDTLTDAVLELLKGERKA